MSQTDTEPDSDTACVPKRRCCCRRLFHVGLGVILLVAILFAFFPRTYTATAWIQVAPTKPYYIFAESQQRDYKSYVNTQFALLRSPLVIDKALENPAVARLPEVARQKDRVGWIAKNLKLQSQQCSEMITVSFTAYSPEAAEEIVNSVVNAFFAYYESQSNDWNARMINQLNLELNRQQNAARLLQDEIRHGLQEATRKGGVPEKEGPLSGGSAQGEFFQRELLLQEVKLETARAELLATMEILGRPNMLEEAALPLKRSLPEKEVAVRAQEILVENLRSRYKEAVQNLGSRTVEIADVSFQQEQLKRVNSVIDLLQSRVVSLQTEMNAPAQIQLRKKATRPQEPDRWWCGGN